MTILKDISVIWSLLHTLMLFIILFESRYPKKKTLILTLSAMIPLIIVNFIVFVILGTEKFIQLMLISCTLPSLIFFWFLAKYRDGRFFFTFCMVDTVVLEIIYITNIIEHYIPGDSYIFLFVTRLIAYPLLEWLTLKKLRPIFIDVQNNTKKGWYTFAAIGAIFYILTTLSMSYPTMVTERPEYLPALFLQFLLMPILYIHIFSTLKHQQKIHEIAEQENILRLQVNNMTERIEVLSESDEKFRMERHNFRHKMKTIASLVEAEEYDELRNLVLEYNDVVRESQVKRYCSNAILDAVLSSYLMKAENIGIKVDVKLAFPDVLPVDSTELATVFANAIENAVHACEKLDTDSRQLDIKVLKTPHFMFQISNSFNGNVEFDKNGIPVNHKAGHGFGTRSIVAFCKKHNADYEFKADGKKFIVRIVF